ncbi:spore coat protein YsxE [Salinibacillus kushneri]|uniref:Spore coat protein YsxE n=1 Tax=Salinibacillus kushneri TaxID=237682 RepID=A0A1I0JEX2_9BACI|nr:phosphotransferase [Salinibacillus kushneri]SEU08676.1 spore coat protein YsxE [Salinibacillus kushneri]
MVKINQVLRHYGMYPYQGEKVTKKVAKVFTGNKHIAVKQSKNSSLPQIFSMVYQIAKEQNLSSIAPLYITEEGKPYIEGSHHFYYVVPWFDTKEESSLTSSINPLFGELGYIHQKTSYTREIDTNQLSEWTENQKKKTKQNFFQFESWISFFESKHYMSPTALLICHSYRMIREVSKLIEYWYDEWLVQIEKEKGMKYALCHGNLSPSHFIYTSNGVVFINWEQAFYGNPSRDMSILLSAIGRQHDAPLDSLMEGLPIYFKNAGCTKSDMALLALHLLNLEKFLRDVQRYVNKPNHFIEVEWIQIFQRHQFYYENILKIQEFIKNEHMIDDEDLS